MVSSKNYIGMQDGEHVFQELDANGLIRGFNGYYLVETVDGQKGLSDSFWCHEVAIGETKLNDGITFKTGMKPAPVVEMPEEIERLYEMNVSSCEECGGQYDMDAYGNDVTYVIVGECTLLCRECVTADDIMLELTEGKDLFKAKNVQGIDLKGFKELETIFCDSSGWGSSNEPAMTADQAEVYVDALLAKSKKDVYAGITGIGQFQVYVTLYTKRAKRSKKSA